jgi:hypothetical protein
MKKANPMDDDWSIIPLSTTNCHSYVIPGDPALKRIYQSPFTTDQSLDSRPKKMYVAKDEFNERFKGKVFEISGPGKDEVQLKDYLQVIYGDKNSIFGGLKWWSAKPPVRE